MVQRFIERNIRLNTFKWQIGVKQINSLDFLDDKERIRSDSKRISPVINVNPMTEKFTLRQILGAL